MPEVWFVERDAKKRIRNVEILRLEEFCEGLSEIIYQQQNFLSKLFDANLTERVIHSVVDWVCNRLEENRNRSKR